LFARESNGYITSPQWISIKKLLTNKETPQFIKTKIERIIYTNYYNKTMYDSYLFRTKNRKYFKQVTHIKNTEIDSYACIGLLKAIKNYDYHGNNNFYKFAKLYIHYELLKSLSELLPLNILPHRYKTQYKYKYLMKQNTVSFQDDSYEGFVNNDMQNVIDVDVVDVIDVNIDLNNMINKLESADVSADVKKIFSYKYQHKFPLAKIAELMCCSKETIRKKLNIAYKQLLQFPILH
jgi:RNA polymerase sigma factor (sigma-70 family)